METSNNASESALIPFPAANDDHRYLRKRASILCAAFNAQRSDVPHDERCQAWEEIVGPNNTKDATEWPVIKGPVYIDYGINVHIQNTCFINRNCFIVDSPQAIISIGAHTIISTDVRLLGVTHPIDWRERQGRQGPSLAGDVKIGNDCFIGCGAIVLPGVTIGDGCVIGAGSVVTMSIPPYHVAHGNPARVIRKVAPDVADAPGTSYEVDRVVGKVNVLKQHERRAERETSLHGERIQDQDQMTQKTDTLVSGLLDGIENPKNTTLKGGMILLLFLLGYWVGGFSS